MLRDRACWVPRPFVYFYAAGSRQAKCFYLQDSPQFSNGEVIPGSGGVAATQGRKALHGLGSRKNYHY